MTFGVESTLMMLLAVLAPDARTDPRANFDVSTSAPAAGERPMTSGAPVAYAPGRDVPSLMWVPRGEAPDASLSIDAGARQQLELHAKGYGISREVIAGARTVHIHDTGRGGIIVLLRQTVGGVDLFHGDIKLLLDRSRRLLAISGAPHPNAHPGAAQPFALGPEAAIATALSDLHREIEAPLVEVDARAGWRRFALAGDSRLRFLAPARARPVYMPVGERLFAAHIVELQTRLGAREDVYQYVIAAEDGRLLMRRDATHRATHQYRVYAGTEGLRLPSDGPLSDFNPHPTGVPGAGPAGVAPAALVEVDGLNTNPEGMPDPWLPAGATATIGNNVDAYIDRLDTDPVEADRTRAPVSGPGVFDYTYDVAQPAMAEDSQYMAALTHAFYVANWLHDWWYDSGFVEEVGAAQYDNFDRGGAEGDRLLLQTQDAASLDLYDYSSIAVPLDGASPRVRFYLFLGQGNDPGLTRDSGLDSLLIAHEYGHLVDTRLADHGTQASRAMGEGWGDFMAQLVSARPGDDLDGAFVSVQWATSDPTAYFGQRRLPFSTDPAYNALSFRHIGDSAVLPDNQPIQPSASPNSEQHNAGEVWASMLWESYVALHRLHEDDLEFEEVRRLMSDYVVAGLMLAPVDATYTEQRDALLMAIAATSHDDMLAVAEAFAERGAGSCAVSPPRHSVDLEGVVEDLEVRGRGVILSASMDDSLASCDGDGLVDVGELGRITVQVFNGGVAALPAGATLEVVDPPAGLMFPDGPSVKLSELSALQQASVTIAVVVAGDFVGPAQAKLRLRLTTPGGCEPPAEANIFAQLEADAAPSGGAIDAVEVTTTWTLAGDDDDEVWSRQPGLDSHVWHGANRSYKTDAALISPPFTVAADQNLVISFDHAFTFDAVAGTFWDGGVIELSDDDGATWHDLGEFVTETTYVGMIDAISNALVNRDAFVGASPGYPALQPVSFDFGTQLAGKTMRLRFRIATNTVNSAEGWSIDNLRFEGITNAPFSHLVADATECEPVEPTTSGDPTSTSDPTTPTNTGSSADDDTASDGSGPASAGADAGCGCVSGASGAGWLGHMLALTLLALRRRGTAR